MRNKKSSINFEWINKLRQTQQHNFDNIYHKVREEIGPENFEVKHGRGGSGETTKPKLYMDNLASIVGTSAGKQDIKRINEAMSLRGAKAWIASNKLKDYSALEEDLDNDGIADVVVRDTKGNLVVVNGYTIKPSDYPLRRLYYEMTKEERAPFAEKGGFRTWVKDEYYKPEYDELGIHIKDYKGHKPTEDRLTLAMKAGGFKLENPRGHTPYQAFARIIVKTIYENTLRRFNLYRADGKKPNIFINVVSEAWQYIVVISVLSSMYNGDMKEVGRVFENKELLKTVMKSRTFKAMVAEVVKGILSIDPSKDNTIIQQIEEITKAEAVKWFNANSHISPMQGFGTEAASSENINENNSEE